MSEVHLVRDILKVEIDGDLVFVTTYKDWNYESTVEYLQLLDAVRARNPQRACRSCWTRERVGVQFPTAADSLTKAL